MTRKPLEPTLLLLYTAVFWAATGWACVRERLWFDELITAYLVRLPSLTALWRCLLEATDNNPPLYHLAARASVAVLGESALALRLPAMLGVWLFSLCVYRFVRVHAGPGYAWTALFLAIASGIGPYAHEARPYGLVLAGCGIALVGWQAAAGHGPRGLGLAGVAVGLAVGVTSHYYSVLLVLPLVAGELARIRDRRRIDVPMALAMALGMAALLPCLPLIAPIRAFQKSFWSKPGPLSIPVSYTVLIGPTAPILALAMLALGCRLSRAGKPPAAAPMLTWSETVVVVSFVGYPVLAFLLAVAATGAYADRYVLPAVAGLAVLASCASAAVANRSARIGWTLALAGLAGAVASRAASHVKDQERFAPVAGLIRPLGLATEPGPIVVCNPDLFLQLNYYAPRGLTERLLYLEAGQNTAEDVLRRLKRHAPLRVEKLESFLDGRPPGSTLYLYGRADDWLANTMPMVSRHMDVRYDDVNRMLSLVTLR